MFHVSSEGWCFRERPAYVIGASVVVACVCPDERCTAASPSKLVSTAITTFISINSHGEASSSMCVCLLRTKRGHVHVEWAGDKCQLIAAGD